jgi:hypothetical protein
MLSSLTGSKLDVCAALHTPPEDSNATGDISATGLETDARETGWLRSPMVPKWREHTRSPLLDDPAAWLALRDPPFPQRGDCVATVNRWGDCELELSRPRVMAIGTGHVRRIV